MTTSAALTAYWGVERRGGPAGALCRPALRSRPVTDLSRTLDEADGPGVAAQVVVRDPPDLCDLASVVRILVGEPFEALRVSEIFHGQRRSDDKVFVKD